MVYQCNKLTVDSVQIGLTGLWNANDDFDID